MSTPKPETTMRVALRLLAGTAALLTGTGRGLASEPGPNALPVNVVAVQTNDADDQAEALSKALRYAVRTMPGWSLANGDYSLEVLSLSLKCADPPDADCQSRIADQIKTDRYVWGNIAKRGADVHGALHLWVRGKGTAVVKVDYSANLTEANDEALRRVALDALTQLTGGPPKAPLHVHAGAEGGQVFVDGQPIGALKAGEGSFSVPIGPHKVTVKAIGYLDVDGQVVVGTTGAAEIALTMVRDGSGKPLSPRLWGGIGALGLGVASGVTGVVSSLQVNNVMNDAQFTAYRQTHTASSDICAPASLPPANIVSLCNTGKTFQAMQIVFYPLAAVATGVGVYLLATAGKPPSKSSGFRWAPQVGVGSASLDVSYAW
jgi:hypothetical protein